MPSIVVRDLEAELVGRLKRRAARHNRSAAAEARDILCRVLSDEPASEFDRLAAELRALIAGCRHNPAEALLRQGRDER